MPKCYDCAGNYDIRSKAPEGVKEFYYEHKREDGSTSKCCRILCASCHDARLLKSKA